MGEEQFIIDDARRPLREYYNRERSEHFPSSDFRNCIQWSSVTSKMPIHGQLRFGERQRIEWRIPWEPSAIVSEQCSPVVIVMVLFIGEDSSMFSIFTQPSTAKASVVIWIM